MIPIWMCHRAHRLLLRPPEVTLLTQEASQALLQQGQLVNSVRTFVAVSTENLGTNAVLLTPNSVIGPMMHL
jgi:hypothetical protein